MKINGGALLQLGIWRRAKDKVAVIGVDSIDVVGCLQLQNQEHLGVWR
jgi:hypothetical protein